METQGVVSSPSAINLMSSSHVFSPPGGWTWYQKWSLWVGQMALYGFSFTPFGFSYVSFNCSPWMPKEAFYPQDMHQQILANENEAYKQSAWGHGLPVLSRFGSGLRPRRVHRVPVAESRVPWVHRKVPELRGISELLARNAVFWVFTFVSQI